jgi:hypothetical protein
MFAGIPMPQMRARARESLERLRRKVRPLPPLPRPRPSVTPPPPITPPRSSLVILRSLRSPPLRSGAAASAAVATRAGSAGTGARAAPAGARDHALVPALFPTAILTVATVAHIAAPAVVTTSSPDAPDRAAAESAARA